MSAVTLREYRHPEDYPAVLALWRAAGPGVHIGASDSEPEIARKAQRDPQLFLVAISEERIVGSVIGGFDGRRGMIYHLTVDMEHRGRGLGSRLMDEVESRLRALGCRKCYLFVTADNQGVGEFYQSRGYEAMTITPYGKELQEKR